MIEVSLCYGCQGGDVFRFVQKTQGIGFIDSVRYLAERFGVILREDRSGHSSTPSRARGSNAERATERQLTDRIFSANYEAMNFFMQQLLQAQQQPETRAAIALNYLLGRGIDLETIRDFNIGYAPAENTNFYAI